MLKYQKGYICNGSVFVVNKEDVCNAQESAFVEATAFLPMPWPPTNADHLRSMTDEELADVVNGSCVDGYCHVDKPRECGRKEWVENRSPCMQCILAWLRQPYEESVKSERE